VPKCEKEYVKGKEVMPVLAGINLTIDEGDFVALMGPSGSGKTTLLNLIGCLDYPMAGDILVGGQSLLGMKAKQLAKWRSENVGFLFLFTICCPCLQHNAMSNCRYC
jgi:putative ABC transport system ATP-binding protein